MIKSLAPVYQINIEGSGASPFGEVLSLSTDLTLIYLT